MERPFSSYAVQDTQCNSGKIRGGSSNQIPKRAPPQHRTRHPPTATDALEQPVPEVLHSALHSCAERRVAGSFGVARKNTTKPGTATAPPPPPPFSAPFSLAPSLRPSLRDLAGIYKIESTKATAP